MPAGDKGAGMVQIQGEERRGVIANSLWNLVPDILIAFVVPPMLGRLSLSGFILIVAMMLSGTITMGGAGTAQKNKSSALDEVVTFATKPASDFTADFRASFAQTLADYCQEVLQSLPTNTPAEDDWVTSEEKTRDGAKIQRLWKSKEYSRSILKATFSECKDTATVLVELIQQFSQKKESSELFSRLEASQFIKLVLTFETFLEPYSSKIEMNKEVKFAMGDLQLHVIRRGLLKAAREALQDVH
jgi:hypothetical protein